MRPVAWGWYGFGLALAGSPLIRLGEQGPHRLKRRGAGVEDAYPVHLAIDRMRHDPVQNREIVGVVLLMAEQGGEGLLAHADVQAEDAFAVQVGGTVELAVVLGHDRGEGEPAVRWEFPA